MVKSETTEHLEAFEKWYSLNRNFAETAKNLNMNLFTLYGWADKYGWHGRATDRFEKAREKAEVESLSATAKLLKRQQTAGAMLVERGIQKLSQKDYAFEDGRTAIAGIKVGIELQRQALGMADTTVEITGAVKVAALTYEELLKLPPDELIRDHSEALGALAETKG